MTTTRTSIIHIRTSTHVSEQQTLFALEEAVRLAQAISLEIHHTTTLKIQRANPATFLGAGHVAQLRDVFQEQDVELAIVNHPLTPIQQRNLERAWGCKVIDRTGLILEIFGERARTAEGRLQVELAALSYQRSRLVRSWTHLERQRGGVGFLGGPGEAQLELDRRMISTRMMRIKKNLEKTKKTRRLQRRARQDVPYPVIALIGYTNAGKSTLFNRLTGAEVLAQDMLFATLDPTMRRIKLPSGRMVVLSDTVGFITQLPTQLVAAFQATLEEVREADLILHVHDVSHPESQQHAAEVDHILRELQLEHALEDGTIVHVFNKSDTLSADELRSLKNKTSRNPAAVMVSSLTGEGLSDLLQTIDQQLNRDHQLHQLTLPAHAGEARAWLHRHGAITQQTLDDDEERVHLSLQMSEADWQTFQHYFPKYFEKNSL